MGNLGDGSKERRPFTVILASKSSIDCKTRKSGILEKELHLIFGSSYDSRFDAGAGIGHHDTTVYR